ncbi:MAG: hypothetical protein HKO08_04715 [Erythrobacter sp.]|nr:hypothetical protein [Erythrobacter sp.]
MKKALFAAATGLMLAATPMQAQETATAPAAPTMQDDLDCAIFLSYVLGTMEEAQATEEEKTGVMVGMIYFIGRYEGAGGADIEGAMLGRFETFEESDIERLRMPCAARMESMGQRLISAGNAITQVEKRRAKTGQ